MDEARRSLPSGPSYRITLFFGPEPVEGPAPGVSCVFNVKKRSWKGGVQVAVEVDDAQVVRARQAIGFEPWLQAALSGLPEADREGYEQRAGELLAQGLCTLKLEAALEDGVAQENQTIPAERFIEAVDRAVLAQADRIKTEILAELDLLQNEC